VAVANGVFALEIDRIDPICLGRAGFLVGVNICEVPAARVRLAGRRKDCAQKERSGREERAERNE
jgi:hypothetical protein